MFDRVFVDSEVAPLEAIVLQPPGPAHRNILPEHVDAHLALKDFVHRRLGIEDEALEQLTLRSDARQPGGLDLLTPGSLWLSYRTHDGHEGTVELGRALEHLLVENPQYILFDDVVDGDRIAAEYDQFDRVVRQVAPHTFRFDELVHDALHRLEIDARARDVFFDRLERMSPSEERANVVRAKRYFLDHGPRRFLALLLTGRDHYGQYVFHPLPNLLFTRDLAAAVGQTLVLSCAAMPTRGRESVLAWLVFTHHPLFADLKARGRIRCVDMLAARLEHPAPQRLAFEGGDLIHLGGGTLLVGTGERTTPEGVIELARRLWSDEPGSSGIDAGVDASGIDLIVMTRILAKRSSMHLDTIFTLAHQRGRLFEAMVYGPFVEEGGFGAITAFAIRPRDVAGDRRPTLADLECWSRRSLGELLHERLGYDMTPIFCGGRPGPPGAEPAPEWSPAESVFYGRFPNQLGAKREQWTDGANVFALAPGIITLYARNRRSIGELAAHGYRVVDVDTFCANAQYYLHRARQDDDVRIAIPLAGAELSRGRGGPRCMTLPLLRGWSD